MVSLISGSGSLSLAGLNENATVDYPPAENQLGEIPCCHVCMIPEDRNGMDLRLLLDAVFKFFYNMCAQFTVNDQLPHPVPLYLFTSGGTNDAYNEAARQVIRAFANLSRKVQLKEYDLSHKLAEQMYAQQGGQPGAEAGAAGGAKPDDDVVDAEFEEVKDK